MSHVPNNNGSIRNKRPHCLHNTLRGGAVSTSSSSAAKLAENGKPLSCRQRQCKKDESIRKKIEQELSKKSQSRISTKGVIYHPDKRIKGTVSALGISPALTVGTNLTVLEAAQLMMVKKHSCVIVVDNHGDPCGVITAKDITYRLVACRQSARSTTVVDIMERNLVRVASTTPAYVAIDLMITRQAYHAIAHSKDGNMAGLLDITKCLHIFIRRMEKIHLSGKVEKGCLQCASYLHTHTESSRDNTVHPTLLALSKHHPHKKSKFIQASIRDQVRNVIDMMKVNGATAALVYDNCRLAGIFTPKDVVLRVVAAGIALDNCSMVRVMTPHPDVATFSTSIQDALKMMNAGCFKHIPIVDENGDNVDLVDMMTLIVSLFENHRTWLCSDDGAHSSCVTTADDDHDNTADSGFSSPMLLHETPILRLAGPSGNSRSQPETMSTHITHTREVSLIQNIFAFKFTVGNTTHRINWDCRDFSGLRAIIQQRVIAASQYSVTTYPRSSSIAIAYRDNEGDEILMTCDADLIDAVQMAHNMGQDRVRLVVYNSTTIEDPEAAFNDFEDIALSTQMRERHQIEVKAMKCLSAQASSAPTLREDAFGYPSSTTVATVPFIDDDDDPKQRGAFTEGILKRQDNNQERAEQHPTHGQWIADHLLLPTTISFLGVAIISALNL